MMEEPMKPERYVIQRAYDKWGSRDFMIGWDDRFGPIWCGDHKQAVRIWGRECAQYAASRACCMIIGWFGTTSIISILPEKELANVH
jgi:hypothetical protein